MVPKPSIFSPFNKEPAGTEIVAYNLYAYQYTNRHRRKCCLPERAPDIPHKTIIGQQPTGSQEAYSLVSGWTQTKNNNFQFMIWSAMLLACKEWTVFQKHGGLLEVMCQISRKVGNQATIENYFNDIPALALLPPIANKVKHAVCNYPKHEAQSLLPSFTLDFGTTSYNIMLFGLGEVGNWPKQSSIFTDYSEKNGKGHRTEHLNIFFRDFFKKVKILDCLDLATLIIAFGNAAK